MSNRNSLLSLIAVVAIGIATAVTPSATRAQSPNLGHVVEAIARANAAHLALARKMASDPAFAAAMANAMNSGNYDAAASLVSMATGVAKSNIQASAKSSAAIGANTAAQSDRASVFRLASLERAPSATTFTWNFCLTFSFFGNYLTNAVKSCMTWPWG